MAGLGGNEPPKGARVLIALSFLIKKPRCACFSIKLRPCFILFKYLFYNIITEMVRQEGLAPSPDLNGADFKSAVFFCFTTGAN